MTMTDLLTELESVVALADKATPGEWPWPEFPEHSPNEAFIRLGAGYVEFGGSGSRRAANAMAVAAAMHFIRAHHAEIAEAVRDAARFHALERFYTAANFRPEDVDLGEGVALIFILPKGSSVSGNLGRTIDAAMRNSEREDETHD